MCQFSERLLAKQFLLLDNNNWRQYSYEFEDVKDEEFAEMFRQSLDDGKADFDGGCVTANELRMIRMRIWHVHKGFRKKSA